MFISILFVNGNRKNINRKGGGVLSEQQLYVLAGVDPGNLKKGGPSKKMINFGLIFGNFYKFSWKGAVRPHVFWVVSLKLTPYLYPFLFLAIRNLMSSAFSANDTTVGSGVISSFILRLIEQTPVEVVVF